MYLIRYFTLLCFSYLFFINGILFIRFFVFAASMWFHENNIARFKRFMDSFFMIHQCFFLHSATCPFFTVSRLALPCKCVDTPCFFIQINHFRNWLSFPFLATNEIFFFRWGTHPLLVFFFSFVNSPDLYSLRTSHFLQLNQLLKVHSILLFVKMNPISLLNSSSAHHVFVYINTKNIRLPQIYRIWELFCVECHR